MELFPKNVHTLLAKWVVWYSVCSNTHRHTLLLSASDCAAFVSLAALRDLYNVFVLPAPNFVAVVGVKGKTKETFL